MAWPEGIAMGRHFAAATQTLRLRVEETGLETLDAGLPARGHASPPRSRHQAMARLILPA